MQKFDKCLPQHLKESNQKNKFFLFQTVYMDAKAEICQIVLLVF